MSKFYTNFFQRGNNIYVRGFDMGLRFAEKVPYQPFLFVEAKDGPFRTIHGRPVKKINFENIREAKVWLEGNKDVVNRKVYGLTNFAYAYILEEYSGDIDYDPQKMNVGAIDIECAADEGFPDIQKADKEITAITLTLRNRKYTFGCGEFTTDDPNTHYLQCNSEEHLLTMFLKAWNLADLDIITGWNCIPTNSSVWGQNEIFTISDLCDERLYDSKVIRRSPITTKKKFEISLSNGKKIYASKDHKIPCKVVNSERYTNLLSNNRKMVYQNVDLTVEEIMNSKDTIFVEAPLRDNTNADVTDYTYNQLYLAGFVYTDGTLKSKQYPNHGYTIYQSDYNFLQSFDEFGVESSICGDAVKGYSRYMNPKFLGKTHELIYDGNVKKLNKNLISKLSKKQFFHLFSGMLDGDGCVQQNNVSICNYDGDIDTISELLSWNGVFTTQTNNIVRLIDYNYDDLVVRKTSRFKGTSNTTIQRCSSQKAKQIRFKKDEKGYIVRVKCVKETDEWCQMMDIETNTHYFVTGGVRVHNCEFFDIPYLINRIKNLFDEDAPKKLSPWGFINERFVEFRGKENQSYEIMGISVLDYYQVYRKFSFGNQESYKLDFIAQIELGERKLDYSEYGSLLKLYKQNFQKFIEYNIHDTVLVDRLEDKMKFLELIMVLAYDAKINFNDTMTTVRPWDIIIHNYLLERNIVVEPMVDHVMNKELMGGYVKEPKIGMSKWVVSFDLDSLYPHLIMQYNISPETFHTRDNKFFDIDSLVAGNHPEKDEFSHAANGCSFWKDHQGFLPALMERMYNDRSKYKKLMIEAKQSYEQTHSPDDEKLVARYHNFQMAKKIQLNSAYGALGNQYFRWFDFNLAEAITSSGQLSIRWIERKINEFMNKVCKTEGVDYVIASDTDSIYVTMENMVGRLPKDTPEKNIVDAIDEFCEEKIQPYISACYQELADNMNAYQQKMKMKRETIANKGIWRRKKMYILNAWDVEGVRYEKPKLKIQGIESARSDKPMVVREGLKKCFDIIMNGSQEELIDYVCDFEENFLSLPFDEVAFPRGVNDMEKYFTVNSSLMCDDDEDDYKDKTPIHVKGAIIFNKMLKKLKIETVPPISNGDKVKFCYLKLPNPTHEAVIAVPDVLPDEMKNLVNYIDRQTQYEKTFLNPLQSITKIIDWETERRLTLWD